MHYLISEFLSIMFSTHNRIGTCNRFNNKLYFEVGYRTKDYKTPVFSY